VLHQLERRVQFEVNGVPWIEFESINAYVLPIRHSS